MRVRPARPRNMMELASLVVEAAEKEPEHPDWTRKDYEANLTAMLCGDGTPENPGLLSAQVQQDLALSYSDNPQELFLRQLDALADVMAQSDDSELQAGSAQTKSWLAEFLKPHDRRREAATIISR